MFLKMLLGTNSLLLFDKFHRYITRTKLINDRVFFIYFENTMKVVVLHVAPSLGVRFENIVQLKTRHFEAVIVKQCQKY